MGHLTADPIMNYTSDNTPVINFSLACNRKYKKKDQTQGEEVLFVDCTAFGRTAELINQFFGKGGCIHIVGRLKLDKWQDKQTEQCHHDKKSSLPRSRKLSSSKS